MASHRISIQLASKTQYLDCETSSLLFSESFGSMSDSYARTEVPSPTLCNEISHGEGTSCFVLAPTNVVPLWSFSVRSPISRPELLRELITFHVSHTEIKLTMMHKKRATVLLGRHKKGRRLNKNANSDVRCSERDCPTCPDPMYDV